MKNIDCAQFELLIAARENGSIDPDAATRLDAHLIRCAACTSLVLTTPPIGGDNAPSSAPSNGAYVLGRCCCHAHRCGSPVSASQRGR